MKKIAGIALVAVVLVGAPLAWHYHSPLPFLPPFPGKHPAPPAELTAPTDAQAQQDPPPSEEPSGVPALPPPGFPQDQAPESSEGQPSAPALGDEEELFSLEAVQVPEETPSATPEQTSLTLPPPQTMDVPPPLPVLP